MVKVKQSTIQNAGEGLFAKINFSPNQLLCYFNGVQVESSNSEYSMNLDSDEEVSQNMIMDLFLYIC